MAKMLLEANPSRLPTNGRTMPFSLPLLRDLPTVQPALRWLLGSRGKMSSDRELLVRSRLCGILIADGSANWKVNGTLAVRFATAALKRLPEDPVQLGNILHGVGEMNARVTAPLLGALIKHLAAHRPHISFFKVLQTAAEREAKHSMKPSLSAIDLAQWISGAPLNWLTFDRAVHRIGHPDFSVSPGRFGLDFVAKIVATIEPRAIDRWIAGHRNRIRSAIMANAMLPSIYDTDLVGRTALLLKSKIPALRCLAAALYVCPIFPHPSWDGFRDCYRSLVANGIDAGDAVWMIAYRIKSTVHGRYWTEDQLKKARARLLYLESKPEAAVGGLGNFEGETRMLRRQIENASQRLSKLVSDLEEMLTDLAADWPVDGLTDDQMQSLEFNFVRTPEIRHRLAEKLPFGADRTSLLDRNIDQLREFLGLDKENVLDDYFNAGDIQFDVIVPWAAQSLILRYEGDPRGIGKRTSDLVAGITIKFEALADAPFAAARKPERWQSAFGRATSAYIFALFVVALMPPQRRAEVERLNELALDHVFQLLCVKHSDFSASQLVFKLTALSVSQMDYLESNSVRRRLWAESPEMPDFPRALALWSSPALVEENSTLAFELLRRVGELPLSRGAYDLQISRLLTLVDLAIARCISGGKPALVREVISIWPEVYRPWQPIADRWATAPEMMAAAVDREGPERTAFLAEPSFASTHCFRLIERPRVTAPSEPKGLR